MNVGTIYLIWNQTTGKVYVGQAQWDQRYRRPRDHFKRAESNPHLRSSIQKYGRTSFEIITLEEVVGEQADLDAAEAYWMSRYDARNPANGYNIREAGGRGKHSEASKLKMSQSNIGIRKSAEHCAALSKSHADSLVNRAHILSLHAKNRSNPEFGLKVALGRGSRPFVCIETGVRYQTIMNAVRDLSLCSGPIYGVLHGHRKQTGGYTFRYVDAVGLSPTGKPETSW